jgi:hypothetical protein
MTEQEFDGYIVAGYDEGAFLKADWDGEVHPNLIKGLNALNACRSAGYEDYSLYGLAKIDLKAKS